MMAGLVVNSQGKFEKAVATGLVATSFLLLFLPMLWDFGSQYWLKEEDSHSIALLLGIAYAYARDRNRYGWNARTLETLLGSSIVLVGLVLYGLGRYQDFFQLEGFSLPIIVSGSTLAIAGSGALKRWAIPNALLLFTIPLLGSAVDSILVPLRLMLTAAVTKTLSIFGLHVANIGVTIIIGFAKLNIAGACIGLRSMISLLSIAILYLYLFPLKTKTSIFAFLMLVPVVTLFSNFLRILALVLIAYQFGTSVEGAFHDIAAYVEVIVAVSLFMALRALLEQRVGELRPQRHAQ